MEYVRLWRIVDDHHLGEVPPKTTQVLTNRERGGNGKRGGGMNNAHVHHGSHDNKATTRGEYSNNRVTHSLVRITFICHPAKKKKMSW